MFQNVSKVVVCGRRNTLVSFSEDELHFSWQAQHLGDLHRHCAWQAQTCRVACVLRIALSGLGHVQTARQAWHFVRCVEN